MVLQVAVRFLHNHGQRDLLHHHLCSVTGTSKSSLQIMGSLSYSSGSHGPFWDPLQVFFLLSPFTCFFEVGILFWFSIFTDGITFVLQQHAKTKVCSSNMSWSSYWTGPEIVGVSVHLTGLVSSLHVTGFEQGAPWYAS